MASEIVDLINSPGIVKNFPVQRLTKAAFSDGMNARFNEEGVGQFTGNQELFSDASFSPKWLTAFPPLTNPKWVYGDETRLYAVVGETHTELTRLSGPYTGSASERWHSCFLNGVGIFNNTIDVPQVWTEFETDTRLIDLPNWDVTRRAKSIRSFKSFLIALNMTDSSVERPYRVVWSNPAPPGTYPSSWNTGDPAVDAREFDLAETGDHLVDSLTLGDINIIYKETSTWGMSFIGAPNFFRFYNILPDKGLLHRDCVVKYPRGHVVATQDDIITHAGTPNSYQSIVDSKLRKWLFSTIDPVNFKNCFMFTDGFTKEVWFCFPEVGNTYATKALVWDWESNSTGLRDLSSIPFISVGPLGDSLIDDPEWGD